MHDITIILGSRSLAKASKYTLVRFKDKKLQKYVSYLPQSIVGVEKEGVFKRQWL